jgi:hypothetical protein
MVGDKIAFKTMYGFMTGSPEGIAADTPTISAAEQYTIGIPGQEVGLAARPGLQYGQTITLRNPANEFLQSDPNGWVYIRGSNGDWNHFDVLSPLHRQGLVEFGDDVILRAHNTKMLSTNGDGELLATHLIPDENCIFTLIGSHGGAAALPLSIPREPFSLSCSTALPRSLHPPFACLLVVCVAHDVTRGCRCSYPQPRPNCASWVPRVHRRRKGKLSCDAGHVGPLPAVGQLHPRVQPASEDVDVSLYPIVKKIKHVSFQ